MNERSGLLRELRSCLLVKALLLVLPLSHAQTEPPAILWQSRNITYNALDIEFAAFWHMALSMNLDGSRPPTATAIIPPGKQISEVLSELTLYDGNSMPIQLDILTCLLNDRVCKVTPGQGGDLRASDASAKWTIQPNAEIVVPDFKFQKLTAHKPYPKKAGETLKEIAQKRQSCKTFDAACERYINSLNPTIAKPIDINFEGLVVLPTTIYRTQIPIEPHVNLEELVKSNAALARRAVSPARAELRSAEGASVSGAAPQKMDRARLLQSISHPLATMPTLSFPGSAHSTVAVLDAWVDPKHCMLERVKVWNPEMLGGDVAKAADCGESGDSVRATDHGTHVVGLIGARLGVKGGPGVNPYATIHALCMDESRFTSAVYVSDLVQRLLALYQEKAPTVVNMSFSYRPIPGFADILRDTMIDAQYNTVFVAAAGNEKANLARDGTCSAGPACYDLPNVIVVAALNQNMDTPDLWSEGADGADGSKARGSNYGDRVHVAAPGQGILSTISGNRVGTFDGTSQAAPLVAGSVSLLHHQAGVRAPADVKDRVIYTSDLFSNLYDKMRGGRLNVKRLLEVQHAIVQTSDGKALLAAERPQNLRVVFTEVGSDRQISLAFPLVQRLKFNADLGHYTLFYYDNEAGPLQRAFVKLRSQKTKLDFTVRDPGKPARTEPVALGDIVDYTAPMR